MSEHYHGGPAFPINYQFKIEDGSTEYQRWKGISLRDYFAARAMQGMLSNAALKRENQGEGEFIDMVVGDSWMAADAMLAERSK